MTLATFASIVGPSIATLMAIFALVVVRGTKVSEFRQKWIDDQRADLAVIIAESSKLSPSTSSTGNELAQFDLAAARIKLREKPPQSGLKYYWRKITLRSVGPEWEDAIGSIETLRGILTGVVVGGDIGATQVELIAQSRIRLKAEWERVRAGEIGYKLLILLAALLALAPLLPLVASTLDLLTKTGNIATPIEVLNNSGYEKKS